MLILALPLLVLLSCRKKWEQYANYLQCHITIQYLNDREFLLPASAGWSYPSGSSTIFAMSHKVSGHLFGVSFNICFPIAALLHMSCKPLHHTIDAGASWIGQSSWSWAIAIRMSSLTGTGAVSVCIVFWSLSLVLFANFKFEYHFWYRGFHVWLSQVAIISNSIFELAFRRSVVVRRSNRLSRHTSHSGLLVEEVVIRWCH